jgi:heavy metal sensor kinase
MPPLKLRTKLAASYAVLFVTLLGSSGLAVYELLAYRLRDAADDNLVDHVAGLWGYVEFHGDSPAIKFDPHNPYVAYFLREATRYYQIYDARDGKLLLQSDDSALEQLALSPGQALRFAAHPGIDTSEHNKVPLRFRSAVFQSGGHPYLVRVGVSVEHDLAGLAELRNVLFVLLPFATAIAVAGAWWTAGRTLRPLRNLEEEADEITFQHLGRRLPLRGTKDELDSLTERFNQVLGRLEASVRQMRNFADFMAHELRTPMTVLRGEIEVELMRPELPDEWRQHLASHLEEFDKLSRLINRFLLIAKAETGGIRMNRERLDLRKSLASVARELEPLSQGYGVQVTLTGEGDIQVLADREWMERAFLNLLDNALKFTPSGGRIQVTTRQVANTVTVEIRDSGRGISATDLPHIFEHSYRADDSQAQHETPGGLGLALTKWVVVQHRGAIHVTSAPDEGAVFTITLPSLTLSEREFSQIRQLANRAAKPVLKD